MLSRGDYTFWLGASADADPATHEPSRVAPSPPSGECPLRCSHPLPIICTTSTGWWTECVDCGAVIDAGERK